MSAAVQPERILRELAGLWESLGKEGAGEESQGVLRACAMTLIVVTASEPGRPDVGETIAQLMKEQPSRAIVVRIDPSPDAVLESRVLAQCWMPFGKRQQICCEQIEICAPESRLEDAAGVLLGLTVPDLPVVLWIRSAPLLLRPQLEKLLWLAKTLIVDSAALPEPAIAVRAMQDRLEHGWRVKDLSWTRLTRWREPLSQAVADAGLAGTPESFESVTISRGGRETVETLYLTAWFAALLPRAAIRAEELAGDAGLRGITLRSGGQEICLSSTGGACASLRVGSVEQVVVFREINEYALLREEFSIPGRDPEFEKVLRGAAGLLKG